MPRTKKIEAILKSTRDESEWIAEAQDGSGVAGQHQSPATALHVLGERLREHHGCEVELSYEFELPASIKQKVDQLIANEKQLQELTHSIPALRIEVANVLQKRLMKQNDIAAIMQLSQGYLASIIKRGASDKYVKMNARRRT